MWTTMGWEGAGFASTPWKMMRAASLSNHVCAGKWDNFFLLSLYPSIYIFFFLCVMGRLSHTLLYCSPRHTHASHTSFWKKKWIARIGTPKLLAAMANHKHKPGTYMPSPFFFSPSFRLLFRLLFLFFFGVISGTTLPMCPLTPHASLMCIIADHCPLFLPPPSSPSYFLLKWKRSASQNGGEFYYSHKYHLSAHRSRQHTHVRARAHIHARTHIRAHAHTRKRCSPKCIGPCHDS